MKKFLLTMLLAVVGGVNAWAQTNATSITDGGYYRIYSPAKSKYLYADNSNNGLSINEPAASNNTGVFQFTVSNGNYTIATVGVDGRYLTGFTSGDKFNIKSKNWVTLSTTSKEWQVTNNSSARTEIYKTAWIIGEPSALVTADNWWNTNVSGSNGGVLRWKVDEGSKDDDGSYFYLYPVKTYAVTVDNGLSATVKVTANGLSSSVTGTSGTVYVDEAAVVDASMISVSKMTTGYEFSSVSIDNENKTITVNLAEQTISNGYYRIYAKRSTHQGRCYVYYDNDNSVIKCTAKDSYYEGTDNMDVWRIDATASSGVYTMKNTGKGTYVNITSGASSGTLSLGNSQNLTFHAVTSSEATSSFGNTYGWVISDGSDNTRRFFNTNAGNNAGVYSADAGDPVALYPLTAYAVTVYGGESDTQVTFTAENHSSKITGTYGTVYVDSRVTPTIANVSVSGSYSVQRVSSSGTSVNVYLAKSAYLKPSAYMHVGTSSQSSTEAMLNLNYNGGICYGLMAFDVSSIKTQLATGNYEVGSAFLQLTNGWNNNRTLNIYTFANDFTSQDLSVNRSEVESTVAGSTIATVTLKSTSNKKTFELYNTGSSNPYDIAGYQSTSTSFAGTIADLEGNTLRLALSNPSVGTSKENCQFYTNEATSTNYGNSTCSGYAWNMESEAWEQTGENPKRYNQMCTYFGMSESQFVEAVSPKLIVVLVPKKVNIISGVSPKSVTTKISDDNNPAHYTGVATREFVDNSGSTVDNKMFSSTSDGHWLYIGRENTSNIASIKLNLAFSQINLSDANKAVGLTLRGAETTAGAAAITDNTTSNPGTAIATIRGTQTVNGQGLDGYPVSGKWGLGADYWIDFVNNTITVDEAGFKEYWKGKGEATATLTSTNAIRGLSYTSQFESFASTFKTAECMDLYIASTWAQFGRVGCSGVTIYYKDGSSASVPVTSLTAGGVTTEVTGNYTPAMIQNAYLNTNADAHPTAATLGATTLTTSNISAFTALKDANIDVTASSASYEMTVNSYGASTLMLPFDAALPDGVSAWTLNYSSGDKVTATTADAITANTPVLINANAGNYTFTATDATIDPVSQASGALTGVYATTNVNYDTDNSYILWANAENPIGFYKSNNSTVAAYRAYLTAEGAGARSLSIVFGDEETTGVNSMNNVQCTMNNKVYDLQGRHVAQPTKGLYIVNGKKVFVN